MKHADFRTAEHAIEPILAAGLPYEYTQTPADFFAAEPEQRRGTNCKDVGHQALRQLCGIYLPPEIQIVEAHQSPLFGRVAGKPQLGDWMMLGRPTRSDQPFRPEFDAHGALLNWQEFDVNHLAVYLGEFSGETMILHATPEADGAVINTLRQATADRRTSVIHEVLRANPVA